MQVSKIKNQFLKTTAILFMVAFILIILVFLSVNTAEAQEVDTIMTWQAMNFYPSNYQGKAFPTDQTPINVSATFVINGQIVNPPNTELRWYVDGDLIYNNVGLNQITINTRGDSGEHKVRLEGLINNTPVRSTIIIPRQKPELIIESRHPFNTIWGLPAAYRAVPFFFNVSSLNDLEFSWGLNNRTVDGNINRLIVGQDDINNESNMLIRSTAKNVNRAVERTQSSKIINIIN